MVAAKNTAADDSAEDTSTADATAEPEAPEADESADAPEASPIGFGEAPPITTGANTATPEKGKPVVLATPLLQALSLPDLGGDGGTTITSDGVALSKADAKKAYEAAASCGIELIDKTPAEPEKEKGED